MLSKRIGIEKIQKSMQFIKQNFPIVKYSQHSVNSLTINLKMVSFTLLEGNFYTILQAVLYLWVILRNAAFDPHLKLPPQFTL